MNFTKDQGPKLNLQRIGGHGDPKKEFYKGPGIQKNDFYNKRVTADLKRMIFIKDKKVSVLKGNQPKALRSLFIKFSKLLGR